MRLFLAIDIPFELKDRVVAAREQLAEGVQGVKWVEDQNLHLTIKFLGEVRENQVTDVVEVTQKTLRSCPKFRLEIGDPGFFPNARNPRVIWLAIKGETEVAGRVARALDDSLMPLGFEADKRRRLHLTLGRFRSDVSCKVLVENSQNFKGFAGKLEFEVNQVVLYHSTLTRNGPIYSIVEKIAFNG